MSNKQTSDIWDKTIIKQMAMNMCQKQGFNPLDTWGPNKKNRSWHKFSPQVREVIAEIEKAGFAIIKKERIKECDKCDAAVTIWLQEDIDKIKKDADELYKSLQEDISNA